mmetsp:Transcript_5395/g.7889  ORF Transcript_5395/g.7889 Transcript_5395/m.7889 type:complete len:239 (+) Transcript_5395:1793-2509(+)
MIHTLLEYALFLPSHKVSSFFGGQNKDGCNEQLGDEAMSFAKEVNDDTKSSLLTLCIPLVSQILRIINPFIKVLDVGIIALLIHITEILSFSSSTNEILVDEKLTHLCSKALESVLVGCITMSQSSNKNCDNDNDKNNHDKGWDTFSSVFSHIVQTIVSCKIVTYYHKSDAKTHNKETSQLCCCRPSPSLMEFFCYVDASLLKHYHVCGATKNMMHLPRAVLLRMGNSHRFSTQMRRI